MNAALCLLAVLALQSRQSDEEKAIEVFKSYVKALKGADYERAGDLMHPKSLVKFRDGIVKSTERAPDASRQTLARKLGFGDWAELEKAAPRALFVAFLSNLKELGEVGRRVIDGLEGSDATIIGALKKDGKVYIIAEKTAVVGTETHVTPVLQVVYMDGEHWKMAGRGESNIGK